ncbi:unnamed protein product [Sphagnum balticum]
MLTNAIGRFKDYARKLLTDRTLSNEERTACFVGMDWAKWYIDIASVDGDKIRDQIDNEVLEMAKGVEYDPSLTGKALMLQFPQVFQDTAEDTAEDDVEEEKVDAKTAVHFKIRNAAAKGNVSTRTFSLATHGENFLELANEFEKANTHRKSELDKIPAGDRIRPDKTESEPVEETVETVEEEIVNSEDNDDDDLDETEDDESLDDDHEDDSDDEDDDDGTVKISKKELQILQKKASKSSKKDDTIAELRDLLGKKANNVSDEDFTDLTDELAKELGITDKDNAAKLLKVMSKLSDRKLKGLQEKLDKYETRETEKSIGETYQTEFKSFTPILKKEFANISDADFKKVSDLMYELSHSPKTGGVEYVDSDGKRKLNPYDLDYIFFKNRAKFEEVIDGKKVRGMETSRTRQATHREANNGESKPITRDSSVADIAARDKALREGEAKRESLRDGGNNRI